MITPATYRWIRTRLAELGFGEDYMWSEHLEPPPWRCAASTCGSS